MRPTIRAVAAFGFTIPLALIMVAGFPERWQLALVAPAATVAAMFIDAAMALPRRRLRSEVQVPPRIYVGNSDTAAVTLTAAWRTEPDITALLEIEGEAREPETATRRLSGGKAGLALPLVPLRRGRLRIVALWLRWRGPWGLVELRCRRPVGAEIDIVPNVGSIHEEALQFFSRDALYGVKSQRMRGEGSEFDNLCDFERGMDSRFIDWKRSARHRKLLSKEFRQERNHHIILGFDTGHLMLEPIGGMPRLDAAIHAGMLLGWISLRQGDLVGGCGFDARMRHFIQPGRGMPYFTQIQRFAAGLEYHSEETNYTLGLTELNSRLGRRALVIVFSEFVDSVSAELLIESLQLMARRHVVVFVTMRDPTLLGMRDAAPAHFAPIAQAVLAADFIRERTVVLERIARLGVHCLDAAAGDVSTALINRYLLIKQRGVL